MTLRNLIGLTVCAVLMLPVIACSQEDTSARAKNSDEGMKVAEADKGKTVYEKTCASCHDAGVAGAPKTGDSAAWSDRIAKGKETLYKHSIEGFKAMPAKGGVSSLSDGEVKAAVDYMVEQSR